ncbi:hypothetical protein SEA_MORGANA_29 [Gordonia phage Morgana]|uniref:Sel1 repeat family protein n=1 Tax=Gordonia phage Morgana TaxID=3137292 RepID=A0AAX4RAS5_9CAUD
MSDATDALEGARQLGDSAAFGKGKTSRQLSDEYVPDTKGWARRAIERAALTAWLLVQRRPSTSPYRTSSAPIGDTADFVQWTDGTVHALYVEQGAMFGDPESLLLVRSAAAGGNPRAKALLSYLGSK